MLCTVNKVLRLYLGHCQAFHADHATVIQVPSYFCMHWIEAKSIWVRPHGCDQQMISVTALNKQITGFNEYLL